ncbi:acyltransferase [Faecalicoccus acidiformans]|uniref:Acyltransferase family protein n=1 Tax=Faecalicoccus acidiformans TaxID=915173 RepID=A0ABS2FMX2_9FIRM|nr:acyltransferase family protein [Faecalicoccus acidiformans]MBM6831326.1 acyltransferase family protein [Faecalicoccus acidiformans]
MVKQEPIYSFYYLRTISCLGIVLLHFMSGAIGLYGSVVTQNELLISKIVLNLLLWCVPCFVMITGALLLDKNKELSIEKVLKKYVLRILEALLFCCVIFIIYDTVVHKEPIGLCLIVEMIFDFFLGNSWSHLWYLYLLIGIYLLLPIYKVITSNASDKLIKYLLFIYFVFLSLIPMLEVFRIHIAFYITVSSIYPFYLFFGYALHHEIISLKRYQSLLMFILSSLCIILLTILNQENMNLDFEPLLNNYSSIFVVIQSIGIFSLVDNIKWKKSAWVKKIDVLTFGVYLVHMIFIRSILKYMSINPFLNIPVLNITILVIMIFILSLLVVMALKKVPIINKFI